MHGPVDGEVSRSSRIPPSIAATVARRVRPAVFVSWRRAPQVLAAAGPVDGRDHRALIRRGQRGSHRALAPALVPGVGPVGDADPARRPARSRAQRRTYHGIRDPGGALVPSLDT